MRRKDRERDAAFALEVINNCTYGSLATVNEDGSPYCIPVSPVIVDGVIYFHCARQGQKLDNIARDNRVCLSCVGGARPLPERFSMAYDSAVCFGSCALVEDESTRLVAMTAIVDKYAASNSENMQTALERMFKVTAIYSITIVSITGKSNV